MYEKENERKVPAWELLPSEEQRGRLSQQVGNLRVIRNSFLRSRNVEVQWGREHLSPEDFLEERYPLLVSQRPFLKKTDRTARDLLLEGLDWTMKRMEQGDPIWFPAAATAENPEGNRYLTKIPPSNVVWSEEEKGAVVLPKIGTAPIPIRIPDQALVPRPEPGQEELEVCILREGRKWFLIFVREEMRQEERNRRRKAAEAEEPQQIREARMKFLRLERAMARKQTDPETGLLSRNGMQNLKRMEKARRHYLNLMIERFRRQQREDAEESGR